MVRYLRLSILLMFLSLFSLAQTAEFSGIITDIEGDEPLFGVNITIKSKTHKDKDSKQLLGTTTDLDGHYTIQLAAGDYVVKYIYLGYNTVVKDISIKAGTTAMHEDVQLEPYAEIIDEVVVSAGKFEQKLQDVTVSLEVIKPTTIENTNTYNVESSLNQVPGVDINNHQPSIRASTGWSYGAGSRIMILMDDLPLMSADAGDAKWNYIPVENISQVEVIKGASSALFGSQALGGAINIRSAYPTSKPQTKINYFYGVYNDPPDKRFKWWNEEFFKQTNKPPVLLRDQLLYWVQKPMYGGLSFSHSQQFENLDICLGGNHFVNEGYRDVEYEKRTRINANIRYRSKKIDGLAVGLNTNFMAIDVSDFFMWAADTLPYQSNMLVNATAATQGYRYNVDPFIYYYKPNGSRYSLRTRIYHTDNIIPIDTNKNSSGDIYYGEFQYQTNAERKWMITAGAVESYSIVKANMYGDHKSNNVALYAQLDARLGRLKLSGGLRCEHFIVDSVQTQTIMTFGKKSVSIPIKPVVRLGANYQVAEATFLRASFGQGYRFPAISEKYTAMTLGFVNVLPNPYLQPETGWSTELAAKQGYKLGSKWKGFADVAFFMQQFDNMMEFGIGLFNTATFMPWQEGEADSLEVLGFQCRNVGKVRIGGVDLSASIMGNISRNTVFTAMVGYTYNYPKSLEGPDSTASNDSQILKYRYLHSLKANINFEVYRFVLGTNIIWKSAMTTVDRLFCDERDDTQTPEYQIFSLLSSVILPGYWDYRLNNLKRQYVNIDIYVGFKFRKELKLSFHVKNLLNRMYCGRPGDMHPPRRFEMSLTANF